MAKAPRTKRRILGPLLVVLASVGVFSGAMVIATSPISPVAWTASEALPLAGAWAPNGRLASMDRLGVPGEGPEDIAMDAEGRIIAGLASGDLIRSVPGGGFEVWLNLGGRVLGMDHAPDGSLVVAVADRGLVSVTPEGSVSELVTEFHDRPLRFIDDVDIALDGTIYFSEASASFRYPDWKLDIIEGRGNGTLFQMEPGGLPRALASNLHFANGVAVAPDESFVLVSETSRYRVRRVWLSGPNAPGSHVWLDGIPGFPDGISATPEGNFWLAIASPRNALLDRTAPVPVLRHGIAMLPERVQPTPARAAHVVLVNPNGDVLESLDDRSEGCFSVITSAEQFGSVLLMGSLQERSIGRLPLEVPAPPAANGSGDATPPR